MIPVSWFFRLLLPLVAVVLFAPTGSSLRCGAATAEESTNRPDASEKKASAPSLPVVTNPYLVLIRDPFVQQSLRLTHKQTHAVRQLTDAVDSRLWKIRPLEPAENAAALARLISETRPLVNKILSPEQQQRLDQIVIRAQGIESLLTADVRHALQLTDAQLQQIAKVVETAKKKCGERQAKKWKGESENRLQADLQAIEKQADQNIAAILEESQQQKWNSLTGESFNTANLGDIKFRAPRLDAADGWLNTPALTIQDLHGKVVVLHFMTYG